MRFVKAAVSALLVTSAIPGLALAQTPAGGETVPAAPAASADAALPGVEWVVGNSHKTQIAELVSAAPYHGNIFVGDIFAQHDFLSAPVEDAAGDRTRPNLKIQDGCDFMCSFCVIPFARGRARSRALHNLLAEARSLVERGAKELVLTGVNIGTYAWEGRTVLDVIEALNTLDGVARIRISSIEPTTIAAAAATRLKTPTTSIASHRFPQSTPNSRAVPSRM